QVRRGHLSVEQLVALDQEVARVGGASHRRMVEDHVAPAVMCKQPVDGGEIDTGLPVGVGGRRGGGDDIHRPDPPAYLGAWGATASRAAAIYAKRTSWQPASMIGTSGSPT